MLLENVLLARGNPVRPLLVEGARRFELGSFAARVRWQAFARPHYAYCVYHAARLAKQLGYPEISIIEFGVAGGSGLVLLERYAEEVGRELGGLQIQVYGFDSGEGLPPPEDFRDLPYLWKPGFYRMDEHALRKRLTSAKLVLGDLRETAPAFFDSYDAAPIAAVMFDLDFYSSTCIALTLFDEDECHRLPRVLCFFDDIIGDETELYSDFTGERLAIREFNDVRTARKIAPAYHLITRSTVEQWYHQVYVLHDFEHSRHDDFISDEPQQLPLRHKGS
jgi:hypothetical protein